MAEIEIKRTTPVMVLDLDGNEIGEFATAAKASLKLRIPVKSILDVVSGRLLKTYDHIFMDIHKYAEWKKKFPSGKLTYASLKRKKNLFLNKK